jgi:protein arginine kinase activator
MKCDRCENEATVHEVTIRQGKKVERHLCEACAREQGIEVQPQVQLGELLTKYVMAHTAGKTAPAPQGRREGIACPTCRLTFSDFRKTGLLGCPDCYRAFEGKLAPLLERAHGGASHHVGKVPRRALSGARPGGRLAAAQDELVEAAQERAQRIALLRKQLDEAVAAEQYERAAKIRDDLRRLGRAEGEAASGEKAS